MRAVRCVDLTSPFTAAIVTLHRHFRPPFPFAVAVALVRRATSSVVLNLARFRHLFPDAGIGAPPARPPRQPWTSITFPFPSAAALGAPELHCTPLTVIDRPWCSSAAVLWKHPIAARLGTAYYGNSSKFVILEVLFYAYPFSLSHQNHELRIAVRKECAMTLRSSSESKFTILYYDSLSWAGEVWHKIMGVVADLKWTIQKGDCCNWIIVKWKRQGEWLGEVIYFHYD